MSVVKVSRHTEDMPSWNALPCEVMRIIMAERGVGMAIDSENGPFTGLKMERSQDFWLRMAPMHDEVPGLH